MTSKNFSVFGSKRKSKAVATQGALDVAAKYFVYKLYDATRHDRMQWLTLRGIDESEATIERAVERGWVVLRRRGGANLRQSEAALTEEGRKLARTGR